MNIPIPCKCGHYQIFHQSSGNYTPDGDICLGLCSCGCYRSMENLQFVEWRAGHYILNTAVRLPVYAFRWAWVVFCNRNFWEAVFACAITFVLGFGIYIVPKLYQRCVHAEQLKTQKIKVMQVQCYSGSVLLYSGKVEEWPSTKETGIVNIKTSKGKFVCNGFHQSEGINED